MQKYQNEKYFDFYMDLAQRASENSVDQRIKVGACVVLSSGLISLGFNGTPSGMCNTCQDENNVTLPHVIHAEMNALKKLLVAGVSIKDAIVFCTLSPCIACAVQLADLGLTAFYYRDDYRSDEGIKFLQNLGVTVRKLK